MEVTVSLAQTPRRNGVCLPGHAAPPFQDGHAGEADHLAGPAQWAPRQAGLPRLWQDRAALPVLVPPEPLQVASASTVKPAVSWLCEAHHGILADAEIVTLLIQQRQRRTGARSL